MEGVQVMRIVAVLLDWRWRGQSTASFAQAGQQESTGALIGYRC